MSDVVDIAKKRAEALAAQVENPKPRPRKAKAAAPEQPPPRDPGPPDDGDDENYYRVPPDSPVQPLGIDGKQFLFMDANHQFTSVHHRDFGGQGLAALFGDHQAYLDGAWPRRNQKGDVLGLDKEWAQRSLMACCARKGVFDSDNRIRGVGAWSDVDGRLIWHLGDAVLTVDAKGHAKMEAVGPIGDHVYPQGVPQIRPDSKKGNPAKSVDRLHALLKQWAWKRGDLDARLQLGWIGCALIGGALRWRPAMWATGGNGTGKSTLHDYVLNPILGGTASVVQTADATGPGLYQALKLRSTPVVFDELEPDPDSRARIAATIKLAKLSSSGARIVRGSPDGTAREFVARAAFLFSSILIPRLEPEVAMRICVLDLLALGDRKEPAINARDMLDVGQDLRRLLVERWAFWPGRLEVWRQKMREKGFSARVADTWGTLLAMADHLLSAEGSSEDTPADTFAEWIDELAPHLDALVAAAGSDHARLLQRMLTSIVDPYSKGQKWPLSMIISIAAGRTQQGDDDADGMSHVKAEQGLETLGLKVMSATPPTPKPEPGEEPLPKPEKIWALAVAGDHSEINKLLRDTKWAGGVYTQTLLRIPGAWSTQQRIARHKLQCTMIPLDLVIPKDGPGSDMFTT